MLSQNALVSDLVNTSQILQLEGKLEALNSEIALKKREILETERSIVELAPMF